MHFSSRFPRQFPHILVATGSIAALGVIAVAHRQFPEQPSHFLDMLVHSLHGPGFMVVTFAVFTVLRLYRRGASNYWHTAMIAVGVGIFGEAVQIPGPRNAELSDLVVDAIGIVGALGLLALLDRDLRRRLALISRLIILVVTVPAVLYSLGPTAGWCYGWLAQKHAVPALLTFEHRWERWTIGNRFSGSIERIPVPDGWPVSGTAIRVTSSRRGGVLEWKAYPDWRDHAVLTFLAASDDGSVHSMTITIEDKRHAGTPEPNRYRTTVQVGPAPTRLSIPIDDIRRNSGGQLDIARVNYLFLRLTDRVGGVPVILDDFRFDK